MAKAELPTGRRTEAFDLAVKKITDSVRAQRAQEVAAAGKTQIDRFKELARELGCSEDEAAFEAALKKLADVKPLPKHEPKKRGAKT